MRLRWIRYVKNIRFWRRPGSKILLGSMRVLILSHILFTSWKFVEAVTSSHMSEGDVSWKRTMPNSFLDKSLKGCNMYTQRAYSTETSSSTIFCLHLKVMSKFVTLVSVSLCKILILRKLNNAVPQLISHLKFFVARATKDSSLIFGVLVSFCTRCSTALFHLRRQIW